MPSEWQKQPGGDDGAVHVYPLNDMRSHVIDGDPCPCLPRTHRAPDADLVVMHNSYDGREVGEVLRATLDMLGVAKPPPWTNEEREQYEHAIQLCDMHWPKGDSEMNDRGTGFPFRPIPKNDDTDARDAE